MKKIDFLGLGSSLFCVILFALIGLYSLKFTNVIHNDLTNSVVEDRTKYNEFVDDFVSKDYIDFEDYVRFIEEQRRLANVNYDFQVSVLDVAKDTLSNIFALTCSVGVIICLLLFIKCLVKSLFSKKSVDIADDSITEEIIVFDNKPNDNEMKFKFTYDDSIYDI